MSSDPINIHLKLMQQAIAQQRVVQLQYFSPSSGQFTERSTEPIGTVRYGNAWHVIAYCQLRQDFRDFRLDRMSKLSVGEATCSPHDPPVLEAYLKRQSQTTDVTWVRAFFDPSVVSLVKNDRYSQGFMLEKPASDAVEMSFLVAEEEAFCRWLLQFSDVAKIVSPDRLQRAFQQMKE